MDVLIELLPPSYTGKSEALAKDSKRQTPQQKNNKVKKQEPELASSADEDKQKKINPSAFYKDRRSGDDRRHQRLNRGRWLESRDRNDRRATDMKVFVKI
ncbi:MAG: hypothetical protein WBC60_09575 [Cognaticolwellia sp.]